MPENPTITLSGRLSFPKFTAQEAYDSSLKGKYPDKSVGEAKPNFQLVLDQSQLDKLVTFLQDEFLPFIGARIKAGEKKNVFAKADLDDILAGLASSTWESKLYQLPIKDINEKTAEMAPEGVASISIKGRAGGRIEQKAIVQDEAEVVNPDYVYTNPVILPINDTVHEMYAGCNVKVTVNFYAYTGAKPGISAGASTVVFHRDNSPFSGGLAVDEDAMFMDD